MSTEGAPPCLRRPHPPRTSSTRFHRYSADLLVAGIATLIQSIGFWCFGVRLPLMQGCTFAAVSPMIVIGSEYGITAIYGSVIGCGLFMMMSAPVFSKLLRFSHRWSPAP